MPSVAEVINPRRKRIIYFFDSVHYNISLPPNFSPIFCAKRRAFGI